MSYPRWTDYTGDVLEIRPALFNVEPEGHAAVIDLDPDGAGVPFVAAAHQLRGIVTALYESADLPVPDLPIIPADGDVEALAKLLATTLRGESPASYKQWAIKLLVHGVRLPAVPK